MPDTWFGVPQVILLLVALQRLAELVLARRNTARLLAAGGVEVGARHYPLFVLLHGSWLVLLFVALPPNAPILWPFLVLFLAAQAGRIWVIRTLGPYWTTRIVTVPGAPLATTGPFRFVRHPNYLVVTVEIAALPLAFGAWGIAAVFTVLNALLLRHRIGVEDAALSERRVKAVA